jgi:hypothetical protein
MTHKGQGEHKACEQAVGPLNHKAGRHVQLANDGDGNSFAGVLAGAAAPPPVAGQAAPGPATHSGPGCADPPPVLCPPASAAARTSYGSSDAAPRLTPVVKR